MVFARRTASKIHFCPPDTSAQDRLERFLVEHVEPAHLELNFQYNQATASKKDVNARPDVLIQPRRLARPPRVNRIVWHEMDEWDHATYPEVLEIQREDRQAKSLAQNSSCEIHLVRNSPYRKPKRKDVDEHDEPDTFFSVLESGRMITDLLDERPPLVQPHKVMKISGCSTLYIYYLNYSPSRITCLDNARAEHSSCTELPVSTLQHSHAQHWPANATPSAAWANALPRPATVVNRHLAPETHHLHQQQAADEQQADLQEPATYLQQMQASRAGDSMQGVQAMQRSAAGASSDAAVTTQALQGQAARPVNVAETPPARHARYMQCFFVPIMLSFMSCPISMVITLSSIHDNVCRCKGCHQHMMM